MIRNPAMATQLANEIQVDRLMRETRKIASGVRLSGSTAERSAIEHIKDVLDCIGLRTEVEFHDAYISLPGAAEIRLGGETLPCITHSFSPQTGKAGLARDVVDVGEPKKVKATEVQGRIALVDALAMPVHVQAVEMAGAEGQVFINSEHTYEGIVSTVWGNPGVGERHRYPRFPVVSVTTDVGDTIRKLLRGGQRRMTIHCSVTTGWIKTPLLVAQLEGAPSDEFVLFTGHIDSWHHGAMDNAAANAAMIEIARVLTQHRQVLFRGLRLAFWSGHSHGRYSGSSWYADEHWHELREKCVTHVNVDSIGGMGASVLSRGAAMSSTRQLGRDAIKLVAAAEFDGSRVGRAGDQSFVALGVPSLWLSLSEQPPSDHPSARAFSSGVGSADSGGLGWWWHTDEDTIDKIDPDLLLRDTKIYLTAILELLTAPLVPLDVLAEADELEDCLRKLARAAADRFDLSTTLVCVERARNVAAQLHSWRDEHRNDPPSNLTATFNTAVRLLLHALIGAQYSGKGPYAQDAASPVPQMPLLHEITTLSALGQSDLAKSLRVDLVRARNQIEDQLYRGVVAAEPAVGDLGRGLR